MTILIRNGKMIDPATKESTIGDMLIADGKIAQTGQYISQSADKVIDASGCFVMPGFIDLHVHLREPGFEYKETIETGCAAAAKGGFTTIFAMPNTKPVADCGEIIRQVEEKAAQVSPIHVHQVGAITKGQAGKELADLEGMYEAGAIAFSEDGKSVMNTDLYRDAMEFAAQKNVPVFAHCEDINLVHGGVMNKDKKAEELGLPGISNAVEDVIVARDILIAKETGARLHLCHCSTADSVRMIELAKADGLPVTGEVCPHHFALSTEDIVCDDANYKMNPPLRSRADVEALKEGLKRDIMDVISTDHAPHSTEEKTGSMKSAPFGIVGLETAAALVWTELVEKDWMSVMQMAEKMSYHPAKIAGIRGGTLQVGAVADVVVFDPQAQYVIDASTFLSKGKNTPFNGKTVKGEVIATIAGGQIAYEK